MEIYTVKPNDNIDQIALTYKVPVDSLIYINQMVYPYALALGQALLIPAANTAKSRVPAESLGYAYPFISPWVLSESLPYLSSLYVFSYGFTEEGELVEPVLDDTWMIEAAKGQRTRPVLTFTSIGPDGRFHSSLITRCWGIYSCSSASSGSWAGPCRRRDFRASTSISSTFRRRTGCLLRSLWPWYGIF